MDRKIYGRFDDGSRVGLPRLMEELFENQRRDWPELAKNHAGLEGVKLRSLSCGGYDVALQCNPRRIASTTASADRGNRSDLPCFLCPERLPDFQAGILYRYHYLILCNPMPIMDRHFTVSCVRHIPQSLDGSLQDFLLLSRDTRPDYTVFYNGARCGASAPDHLHFQACPAAGFPDPTGEEHRGRVEQTIPGGRIYGARGLGRGIAVIEGNSMESVFQLFSGFLAAMRRLLGTPGEPMINAVSRFQEKTWKVAIYPRKKHRPAAFYAEEPSRLLISPGAIDMSGLIILPIPEHFERATSREIRQVYSEVSMDELFVEEAIGRM